MDCNHTGVCFNLSAAIAEVYKWEIAILIEVWKMIEELYRLQLFELEIKYLKWNEM